MTTTSRPTTCPPGPSQAVNPSMRERPTCSPQMAQVFITRAARRGLPLSRLGHGPGRGGGGSEARARIDAFYPTFYPPTVICADLREPETAWLSRGGRVGPLGCV